MKAFVNVSNKRRLGEVVKVNDKTIHIKIMKGAKTNFVIKRHIKKPYIIGFYIAGINIILE